MKIHCLLRTAHYRGERADPVAQAVTVRDGETVAQLAARLLTEDATKHTPRECHHHDWIEIRVEPEEGESRGGY